MFENWRQNLLYILFFDKNFVLFFIIGIWWEKKIKNILFCGFVDDDELIFEGSCFICMQKVNMFEFMLGQIVNYCFVIFRNIIVKNFMLVD